MSRVLLIDPFSGASGDMLLSALIDAGADVARIREQVLSIKELSGVGIEVVDVKRGPFRASQLKVDLPHEHVHRGLSDVTRIIENAKNLSDGTRRRACATFRRLAVAEAKVHGMTVDDVHFHEVGALDAILDIVGFYVASELVGVTEFFYTRLVVGGGQAKSAHGVIPVPSPATLELLAGHAVSFSGRQEELLTPTAAAIIAESFRPIGPDRSITVGSMGYGAGTRESVDLPNILRATVGEIVEARTFVAVIRCTIDDMNPEIYGHAMASLFAEGALEVYFDSVMMKKNRPGIELTVLTEEDDAQRLGQWILANTSTLGLRLAREERIELERRVDNVNTELGTAQIKVGLLPDGSEKASPEFESCRKLAEASNLPIAKVYEIVKQAWSAR